MEEVAEAEVTEGIANDGVFAGTKNFPLFGGGLNQVRAEYLAIMYFVVVYTILKLIFTCYSSQKSTKQHNDSVHSLILNKVVIVSQSMYLFYSNVDSRTQF